MDHFQVPFLGLHVLLVVRHVSVGCVLQVAEVLVLRRFVCKEM